MNSNSRDATAPPATWRDVSEAELPAQDRGQPSPPGLSHEPVELAVILAAGEGSRIARHSKGKPKAAVPLLGLSLGERVLLACMEAELRRFIVVVGNQKEQVRAHFERIAVVRSCEITFVEASDWRLGNGASLLAAAEAIGETRFMLLMVDHLVDPCLIRAVRSAVVQQGEICLGVDRDQDHLFDLDDATKVRLEVGKVREIGKQISGWNAIDTGVFQCTNALFGGLASAASSGRHGLSDGVAVLADRGSTLALDVTGFSWLDVDTPEALRAARRHLLSNLSGKGEDGFISTLINRPISNRISAWLASTPVTPNQISFASFTLSLLGAAFLAQGETVSMLVGGLVVQASSILDGCDGEIARLKHRATRRGAWLDTMLDRYADMAVTLAITLAYARLQPGGLVWLGGMMALAGFILASYATKEYAIRHGYPYPNDILNRLKRRDLRLLGISVGAVTGHPYAAMIALGLLNHACVLGIMVRGWRLSARKT